MLLNALELEEATAEADELAEMLALALRLEALEAELAAQSLMDAVAFADTDALGLAVALDEYAELEPDVTEADPEEMLEEEKEASVRDSD